MKNFRNIISVATLSIAAFGSSNVLAAGSDQYEKRLRVLEERIGKFSDSKRSPVLTVLENAEVSGRLHLDTRFYDEKSNAASSKNDGIDIARARLGIKGKINKDFSYKFENDFANNGSKIKDAYIAYSGFNNVELKLGQFKEAFSLEELTSSNSITFIDRSVAVGSAPSRTVGFQAATHGDIWQVAAGIFGESVSSTSRTDDSKYSASARASVAPINSNGNLIHLGAAISTASLDRNSLTAAGAATNTIDKRTLYGAELALGLKSFSLQGEYIVEDVTYDKDSLATDTTNGKTATFDSYYVQASYILTGEHRVYKSKSGVFAGVKPKSIVGKGGHGAWELAARFSNNDRNADDNGTAINEGNTDEITFGVNWYLNNNMRMMANYAKSDTDKRSSANTGYDAFFLRTQVNF